MAIKKLQYINLKQRNHFWLIFRSITFAHVATEASGISGCYFVSMLTRFIRWEYKVPYFQSLALMERLY